MTLLETLVGPVGYALLAGVGAGWLIAALVRAIVGKPRTADHAPALFTAGLAFGVMLGFWLGVLV